MTNITIYKNSNNQISKFVIDGHSGYAREGSDIVCAAISFLTTNTINSIEAFTDSDFHSKRNVKQKDARVECTFDKGIDDKANVLLQAFELGCKDLAKQYNKYVKLNFEEV